MTARHTFSTPSPITLELRVHRGAVHVTAAETTDTTVDIGGPDSEPMRVDLSADGRRLVIEPVRRTGRHHVDVTVRLPAGSTVRIGAAAAEVTVEGTVAEATVSCAAGRVQVADVDGRTEVHTASGSARLGTVRGPLQLRSASGAVEVEHVTGACSAHSASGEITIGAAEGDISARSASGSIRVREAHRGTVDLHSTSGSVAVGVRRGTLVWLDVSSTSGRVHSDLEADDTRDPSGGGRSARGTEAALTLRARTVSGSVSVTPAGPTPIAL